MYILIREAAIEDLPSILEMYKQPDMDNGNILTIEQAETIFRKILSYPNYKVFVAESDSKIIGTFSLTILDNLAHMGAASGLIEDVVVKTDWLHKGVGKQMMKYAIDYCKKFSCYKVALSSNLKRPNAHQFYESLGFRIHGYSFLTEL